MKRRIKRPRKEWKPWALTSDAVLYEDADLLVVNKPFGIPTQPTIDPLRPNLYASVQQYLLEKTGSSYAGLHHRLDRDTSGAILLTKTKSVNQAVAALFQERKIHKIYQVLTHRGLHLPPKEWEIKDHLGKKNRPGERISYYGSVKSGGDFAHTKFKLLGAYRDGLWLEAEPMTGRTHQIRVHLSERGMPVLGDVLYGRMQKTSVRQPRHHSVNPKAMPTPPSMRMMLHAHRLTFHHPVRENLISVVCPLPGDFRKCLAQLQGGVGGVIS